MSHLVPYPLNIRKFTLKGSFEERLSTVGNVGVEIELTGWSSVIAARRDTTSGASKTSSLIFL